MKRTLFGTDGIRGVANEDPMTPEIALGVGRAIVALFRKQGVRPKVLIGKDTRLSGYMLETALASGICSAGGDVLLVGPLPTPGIAHLTTSMRADAGVVISASHNPYADNGIKIFAAQGFKLPDADEAEIERLMDEGDLGSARPTAGEVGKAFRVADSVGRYVAFLKSTFPKDLQLDGLRIVVDAAHGAGYKVAPLVFEELGAEVVALGVRPNGKNINDACGALHPDAAAAEVLARGAQVGVALDGDADRVILVDEKGQVVDGDRVMALCGTRLLRAGALPTGALVATVMSNLGLERALSAAGGRLIRTAVGDRYVVEEMRRGGHTFGGEQSGHLVFLQHATTGDGVLAALQVLAILLREGRPLSELAKDAMEAVPQVLVNVPLPEKRDLATLPAVTDVIRSVESSLKGTGRLLVRWSGTEPKLRIMIEGPSEEGIRAQAESIADAARAAFQSG